MKSPSNKSIHEQSAISEEEYLKESFIAESISSQIKESIKEQSNVKEAHSQSQQQQQQSSQIKESIRITDSYRADIPEESIHGESIHTENSVKQ